MLSLCRRDEQSAPLRLDGFDLLNQESKSIELSADLSFEMRRQRTTIARFYQSDQGIAVLPGRIQLRAATSRSSPTSRARV
jgi:hypothetical protein